MMAILINCITLGSYQPCYDTKCESNRCQWLKTFDHAIFLFFFMEMLIKMIAMGVSNAPQAYLADYWNRLDCFIVIAGGLEYVLDVGNVNLTSIRTVRVLRPLRAINRIPSMRILVTLLLDTLPMLGNVLLLCFFVFFIFGIIGVQLWSGLLRQRCYISLPANMTKPSYVPSYYRLPNSDKEYLCSTTKDNGLHRCQDLAPLRSTDLSTLCQNSLPLDWQAPKPTIIIERYGNESWERHKYEDRFIDGELVPFDLVPGDESSPFLVKQMSPLIAQSVFQPARYAPDHLDSLPVMRHKRESDDPEQQQRRHLHPPHHRQKTIETSTVSWKLRATSTVRPSSSPTPNVARIYLRDQLRQQRRRSAMQNVSSQVNGSTTHAQHQHHLHRYHRNDRHDHLKGAQRIKLASGVGVVGGKFSHRSSAGTTNGASRSSSAIGIDKNSETPNGDDSLDSVVVETNSNSDQFDTISQSELMKSDKSSRKYYIRKKANKGACINWNKFYTECKAGDINPFQGTISFDNVGMAWTTIFLVISLEGWSDIMYLLQDSHSFWVWIYFVLLIVIGSFFMINLCLVVIATQFSATKKREMERMRQERLKFSSSSTLTAASESTNCYTVIVKSIAKCLRRLRIAFVNNLKRRKCNRLHKKRLRERQLHLESCQVTGIHVGESFVATAATASQAALEVSGRKGGEISRKQTSKVRQRQKSNRTSSAAAAAAAEVTLGGRAVDGEGNNNNNELSGDCAQLANSQLSDVNKQHLSHHHYQHYRQDFDQAEQLSAAALRRSSWKRSSKSARKRNNHDHYNATTSQPEEAAFQVVASGDQLIKQQAQSSSHHRHHYNNAGKSLSSSKRSIRLDKHLECTGGSCKMSALYTKRTNTSRKGDGGAPPSGYLSCKHFQEFDIDEVEISFCPKLISQNESLQQIRYMMNSNIKKLVDHRYFQRLILLAILINAISMGIEYHNQPEQLTEAVEISNIVFACLFLIEMILKLIAHGLYDYVIDGFNCFDGCIVILSILELFESSSGSGLSVLRTFRLLRILKLVRFMPALRRQLVIMLRTLDNVAVFFALLVLFIFIFSILGMNLFGCKFCETLADGTERCDRKNFNSLLWSLVTVFQILTQEDWNVVLFNGMEKTSHWAALYFVLLMTFGNYVLFNLLVAILVEGFSQEDEPKISSASSYTINGKMTKPASGKLNANTPAGYLGSPPDDNNNNNNMKQILSGSPSQFLAGSVCAEQQEYHSTVAAAAVTSKSDYDDSTTIALIPGDLLARNAKPALSYDYEDDNDNNRTDEQVNLQSSSSSSDSSNQCHEQQQEPSTFLPKSDVATSIVVVALQTDQHLLSQTTSIGDGGGTSDSTHSRIGCKLWSEEKSGAINGDGQLDDKDEVVSEWKKDREVRDENQDKLSSLRGAGMCVSCARFTASNGSSTIDNTIAANNNNSNNNGSLAFRDDPCCRCAACDSIVSTSGFVGGSNNFVNVDTQLTGSTAAAAAVGQHRSRLDASTTTTTTTTTGNLANASSQSIEQLRPLPVDNKQAVNEDLSQMADRCGDDGGGVNKGGYSVSSRQASSGKTAAALLVVSGKQQIHSLEEGEEAEAKSRLEQKQQQQTLTRSTSSANFNDGDKLVNLMNTTTTARGHLSAATVAVAAGSSQEEDVSGSTAFRRRRSSTSTALPTAALNKLLGQRQRRMSNDREQRQPNLPTSADDSGRKWLTQVSCEDDPISVTCKRRLNEADVNHHQQQQQQSRNKQKQKIWNYGQLVTSVVADQSSSQVLTNNNTTELTNAHQQSLAYFGFRRPPKRLIYFYDINDDVDEEIDFLTKSLESKSYATSMLGQHDHYLNNIAKNQAAAAKVKADGKRQSLANQQLYKSERERQIKALGLEVGSAISGSLDQLAAAAAVTCTSTSTSAAADKLANASSAFAKRFSQVSQTAKTKDTTSLLSCGQQQNSVELVLNPHWCSMPSHLNRSGVAMMRFYQASYANNFYLGKRERALLNERGRFDKSCCRADYDLYAKALNAFIPKHGIAFDSLKSTAAQQQQQQQTKQQHHIADSSDEFTGNVVVVGPKETEKNSSQLVDTSGVNVDINLGVIYEPFKLFPLVASNAMDNSHTTPTLNGANSNTTNSTAAAAANTTKKQPTSRKTPTIGLTNRKLPPTPLDSSGQNDSTYNAPFETVNRWQRDLLVSLESYANAVARYEARQVLMRKRAQEGAMMMNGGSSNLTRTTSVIRRGSFVFLSKLKMLHGQQQPNQQQHYHHQQQQQRSDRDLTGDQLMNIAAAAAAEHSATFQVPRLSLTKADTLNSQLDFNADEVISKSSRFDLKSSDTHSANAAICSSGAASSSRQRDNSSNGLGAICAVSSEESLTNSLEVETGRLNTNAEEVIAAAAAAVTTEDSFNCQAKMSYLHNPTGASGYSRHSIANLPLQTLTGTLQEIALPRPSSFTPYVNNNNNNCNSNSNSATSNHPIAKRTRAPSIISWFNHHKLWTNESNNRNSCFSQTSQATSILTEKCTDILKPNLRRRRSFSGPFEWLQREQHKKPYDLMLTPAKKQGTQKKKLKRIKMQKSNSSDYHSLNNRRAYKLDSRGFQTKLKGVFYVITHDPLLSNANSTTLQQQQQQHQHQQQPFPKSQFISATLDSRDLQLSNYDLNQSMLTTTNNQVDTKADIMSSNGSSFFNTSADENSLGERTTSRDTNCRSTNSHNQKRTFLRYFRWSQWMIKRRHYSLFIFSPQNRVRRFCLAVTRRKEFDYFVLFFISMNCVTLAMERPKIPPWSKEREFLTVANYYFTFMFTLEMALKVISKGLYYGKDAYLSDSWNIMDGALVGFSLFDLLLSIVADRSPRIFAILRVFRLLRSLRPLRVINRLMGLKLVVQTLLLSLRPIGNIVLICCTFFIIFGILGVQLFKGTFYYCDGPDPLEIMRSVRTKEDCLVDHRNRWVNRKYNFDNLGQALMALFVLSSKDGWVNIMYTGLDAVGVDMQPRENYNEWRLLYFISFLLLVAFFVLNMFVGVVVENFHRCRKEQELEEKARRAEKRQRKLDKRRRKLREPPYYSNYGKFRLLLHKWVTGGYFDLLIAAIIGFNVVFMSLEHYQMPAELIHLLKVTNYGFTAAFILEALIKSTALGMRRYLKDRWNQLDVMIVAMSIIGIIFEEMDSFTLPINPTLLRVLRVMRIARVLKLLKMAKGIRALLDTVMQALPQVGNLGLLFFLLFFIFAALGVELFGRLECNDDYPCSGLMDQHAHFQNFGLAFLTLFRVATGDNWNGIMKDTLRDKCDPSSNCLKNCCISQLIAPLYFVVFVLLAQFVLVNVVVAVLMKHLEESHHEMEIDEEYELDKQLAEELEAKKKALIEARERQNLYWV